MWPFKKDVKQTIPDDPNEAVVDFVRAAYPYGSEAFGIRSIIRVVVFTVVEMKKRGLI